jgi:hypothetical protein
VRLDEIENRLGGLSGLPAAGRAGVGIGTIDPAFGFAQSAMGPFYCTTWIHSRTADNQQ